MSANAWKARRANRTEAVSDAWAQTARLLNRDRKQEARYMLACSYYRGVGTCSNGCYEEPRCRTDEPSAGWSHLLRNGGSRG